VAGKFDKQADHFENDRYVVTSAVGHLVEIKAPEEFDVKRGKWSFNNLPVIPPHFDLAPIDKAKSRLQAVVKLVKRKDVTALINACDAGREGELIFRLIVQYAGGQREESHDQAHPAAVAAEHDAAGDPRRLRQAPQ
jgi:DNA topoisomerase III